MPTYYWIGGTGSKSFTSMANWSATEGGSPAAGPLANGDYLYITRGGSTIDSGLSPGLNVNLFVSDPLAVIGTSSTSLSLNDTSQVRFLASCTAYIANVSGDMGVEVYEDANSVVHITDGGVRLDIASGTAKLSGMSKINVNSYGGNVVVEQTSSAFSSAVLISMSGGFITWGAPLNGATDNVSLNGGSVFTYTNPSSGVNFVDVGPYCTYYHFSSGTITEIWVQGPSSNAVGGNFPFTVTDSQLYAFGALFQNPVSAITYTNPTTKGLTNRSN